MRWEKRQEKIENVLYEQLDEMAGELGLKFPYYPEVLWVGRKVKFEEIGLPKKYDGDFEDIRCGASANLPKYNLILIGKPSYIHTAEEAGHFLHRANSSFNSMRRNLLGAISARSIDEMWGFFLSKLVVPNRKNPFREFADPLPKDYDLEAISNYFKSFYEKTSGSLEAIEFLSHHQGYALGQKLFDHYLSEMISPKQIRRRIKKSLEGTTLVTEEFLRLKYNILK